VRRVILLIIKKELFAFFLENVKHVVRLS